MRIGRSGCDLAFANHALHCSYFGVIRDSKKVWMMREWCVVEKFKQCQFTTTRNRSSLFSYQLANMEGPRSNFLQNSAANKSWLGIDSVWHCCCGNWLERERALPISNYVVWNLRSGYCRCHPETCPTGLDESWICQGISETIRTFDCGETREWKTQAADRFVQYTWNELNETHLFDVSGQVLAFFAGNDLVSDIFSLLSVLVVHDTPGHFSFRRLAPEAQAAGGCHGWILGASGRRDI